MLRVLLVEEANHVVEMWEGSGASWKMTKSASPGRLAAFEEELFKGVGASTAATIDVNDAPVVIAGEHSCACARMCVCTRARACVCCSRPSTVSCSNAPSTLLCKKPLQACGAVPSCSVQCNEWPLDVMNSSVTGRHSADRRVVRLQGYC
eukprot:1158386-Pelagomonas_calceolata.AAC.7